MPLTQFDFRVEQHLSFCLIKPLTDEASVWLSESTDADVYIGGVAVEWRFVEELCHGILDAGLQIAEDGMRMLRSDGGDLVLVE